MVRIALVGCGEHSRSSHATPLARYAAEHPGEIELVAACDLNADRAAEFCRTFGFARQYTDFDRMLEAEKLDGCVSVLPIDHIVNTGIELLERRVPCVIEKPLGKSREEAERLSLAARETQTTHMVSVNRRFMPYLNQVRSWIQASGPLRYVRAVQVRHARTEEDFIWSTTIHVMDALRHIVGEVETFDVINQKPGGSSVLWYRISLLFNNGVTGTVEVLPTAGMVEESYEFFGDGFRARVTAGSGTQRSMECWQENKLVAESKADEREAEDLRNGAYQEVQEFVRALRTGTHAFPEVDDVLPSALICFAIADSVKRPMTVSSVKS
ncbi:MAG TPA: Gfo/Idh/MocA family oxidoreductase [Pyrinomonadaceae bacterium]|nr:Gfo/Idh/MocA family oxidoreductase [Pyrinomonadaceae bacterium]